MINEALAKQYWPKGDPLQDRLLTAWVWGRYSPSRRVRSSVLLATHAMAASVAIRVPRCTFRPPRCRTQRQRSTLVSHLFWWAIRTSGDPHTLVKPVSEALRQASGGLPVAHIHTMDELVVLNTSRERFNMLLLAIFGASALLMAAIGVYGLMTYSVQQRTQELGIRMALGAQASNIRNMVIRQGMTLALIGVVIGIGGAFWLTHFLASFLFGVKALDPTAFIVTPLLLGGVALLAIWIPARRATQVDPMTSLAVRIGLAASSSRKLLTHVLISRSE